MVGYTDIKMLRTNQSHLHLPQDGGTPLFVASQNNNKEVAKLLLTAGASPDLATQVRN